jgi:hypothetical protein
VTGPREVSRASSILVHARPELAVRDEKRLYPAVDRNRQAKSAF